MNVTSTCRSGNRVGLLAAACLVGLTWGGAARGQNTESRREYFTPGLVVETGARRGACDVLTFTRDGVHLLAVGDDKVVRVWRYTPGKGLEPADRPILRWRTWHESRGNIYALALSPDKEQRYVAIGGHGMSSRGSSVAVLDRLTGATRHAFTGSKNTDHGTIWSMAFAPSGKQVAYGAQDGSVWVWDLKDGEATEPRRLNWHYNIKNGKAEYPEFNYVRFVHYLDEDTLLSVAQNGQVLEWTVPPPGGKFRWRERFRFTLAAIHHVIISPDGRWLAAAPERGLPQVEMRSLPNGEARRLINFEDGHYPHRLAFDPTHNRLAVGVRVIALPQPGVNNFYKEIEGYVALCDLSVPNPRPVRGPPVTYNPEAIAIHPDGNHLAVAGGDDHEVTLWDLRTGKKVNEIRGPGTGLWAVALSPDARYLGLKDRRNRNPASPNDRGAGPWRVFDLQLRTWAKPKGAVKDEVVARDKTLPGKLAEFERLIGLLKGRLANSPRAEDRARVAVFEKALAKNAEAGAAARFEEMVRFLGAAKTSQAVGVAPLVRQAEPLARQARERLEAVELADLLKARPAPDHAAGWRILHSLEKGIAVENMPNLQNSDRQNAYYWFVRSPAGKYYVIPLHHDRDRLPRCYAFLPPRKGAPVRLAVGHLWGVSVFDLTSSGPVLRRILRGHEGEVMALDVVENKKRLVMVTVSRDQTVAAWSLEDWPSHPELGGHFILLNGQLLVNDVDGGSPAWEAGLTRGDEIVALGVMGSAGKEYVFNRIGPHPRFGDPVKNPRLKDPENALKVLQNPVPGRELYFGWKREGRKELIEQLTSVYQRPVWRFFPTHDGEWVLWRWRDYYYDTSTNGDFFIGWQRSYDDPLRTPDYYKAEQFRKQFHSPDRIKATLTNWKDSAKLVSFLDIEPPKVMVKVIRKTAEGVTVDLTAVPSRSGENHELERAQLWVNDYRYEDWPTRAALRPDPTTGAFGQSVFIPWEKLRSGVNKLTLQCYNRGGARGEARPAAVANPTARRKPDLYGVFIGVSDYRKSNPPQASLQSAKDASEMASVWAKAGKGLYQNIHIAPPLLDADVTSARILAQLEALKGKVKPDDRLVFHLGGHGTRVEELRDAFKLPEEQLRGLGTFLFCCADFDFKRLRETTVSFDRLYEELVGLPCHKILVLDACHAGDTRTGLENPKANPVRILTQDGVGPIILAACRPEQSAFEHPAVDFGKTFGVFSAAVRRTLQEAFAEADRNKNGTLEPGELFTEVVVQTQAVLGDLRDGGVLQERDQQTPVAFLPSLNENLRLVAPSAP